MPQCACVRLHHLSVLTMSDTGDCPGGSSDESVPKSEEQQSTQAEANLDAKNGPESLDGGQARTGVPQELDSHVYTATSVVLPTQQETTRSHPLTLDWAFGVNNTLPVFCLQDGERLVILYVCAHVAVIYDHTANTQRLLQGHCSPISCLCVSEDRRWLVTADKGQNSLVIVWDTYTRIPVRTLFDCHPEGGTVALALSHDSKHLVLVGAAGRQQRVCVWDWTSESESPLGVTELPEEFGSQKHILFNPNDNTQLVSTSESRVLFYTMEGTTLQYVAPEISDKTFNKVVGAFTHSLFCSGGAEAFSATSLGNLLVWAQKTEEMGKTSSFAPFKLVPLQEDAITVLTQRDSHIVTGDSRGHVKFYDSTLKLISYYCDFNLDSISSLSFGTKLPSHSMGYSQDCTLSARPFVIRNLVISTEMAVIVHVTSQGGMVQTLLKEHADSLQAVVCHPRQPVVAMGSNSGILKVWDYEQRGLVCSRLFQKDPRIECLAYDTYGVYLAVGFANGGVCMLDASSLHSEEIDTFTYSSDSITHITFSHDSQYLATADEGKAVTLFRLCSEEGVQRWRYQGRHHSHYMPIQDLLFGEQLDTGLPRLLSLGEDRRLVEYDVQASGDDRLLILSAERIEQSGVPMCMTWYPPLTTEHFLLTASHLYKMKLYNSTTKMCRKTLLGPCFGSPVRKMMLLPHNSDGDPNACYMAYITTDKVGMQILPLDGNPHRCSAQLCHPTGVSSMAVSHEGRYVFTAGGADRSAFCWEISLGALEAAAALGGKDLIPFYSLLEGGRDGQLFREMEDYFYYSQLRIQGIDSMQTRQVSTHIPLAEVPFVMRALGFYPSEQELEDMQNEVKFGRYAETGQYVTHVDLPEFLRLFVNHRPALGHRLQELQWALSVLGGSDGTGHVQIPRDHLMELLQARGEHMTEEELAECFSTLLGFSPEGGRSEAGNSYVTETLLETDIPAEITLETLVKDILGFPHSNQEASVSSSDVLLPSPKDTNEILS